MTRWDYMILSDAVEIHSEGRLDELGMAGWELAGFDPRGIAFFKRPILIEDDNFIDLNWTPATRPARRKRVAK